MSKTVDLQDAEEAVELVQYAYFKKVRVQMLVVRGSSEYIVGAWASQPPISAACVWVASTKRHLSASVQPASLLSLGPTAPVVLGTGCM